jgi:hypothetical protein
MGRTLQKSGAGPVAMAQIYLAGYAAEHLLTGRRPPEMVRQLALGILAHVDPEIVPVDASGTDGHGAVVEIVRSGVSERAQREIEREAERLYDVARDSLSAVWHAVEAVAARLERVEQLDDARVERILRPFAVRAEVRLVQRAHERV